MEGYIKLAKLVEDLGITRQTARNWKLTGKLDYIKVGNTNWITRETYNKHVKSIKKKRVTLTGLCPICLQLAKEQLAQSHIEVE